MIVKMVAGFMEEAGSYSLEDSDDEEISASTNVKKNNCNLPVLSAWYEVENLCGSSNYYLSINFETYRFGLLFMFIYFYLI